VGLLGRPTHASPSRGLSPHWSGSPTDNPHQRHRKKEEDPHLHTDEAKKTQKQKLVRLRSTRLICHDPKATNSRHAKDSSEIMDSSLLAPTTNHF
jgi:hypothetical protein